MGPEGDARDLRALVLVILPSVARAGGARPWGFRCEIGLPWPTLQRERGEALEQEHRIHSNLFRLERDLGLPMVATNDSHYLCEDDAHAQDVMLCIQTVKSIQDTNIMKFQGSGFFV